MPKSQAPRKRKAPKDSPARRKNEMMNDLNSLRIECNRLLSESSKVYPLLKNKELVKAGDTERIIDVANILSRDVQQMKTRLDEITDSIPDDPNPEDMDMVFPLLSIGEDYQNWQTEFISVIIPTVNQLNALFVDAGQNLGGDKDGE